MSSGQPPGMTPPPSGGMASPMPNDSPHHRQASPSPSRRQPTPSSRSSSPQNLPGGGPQQQQPSPSVSVKIASDYMCGSSIHHTHLLLKTCLKSYSFSLLTCGRCWIMPLSCVCGQNMIAYLLFHHTFIYRSI